jgi:hypothetical protein
MKPSMHVVESWRHHSAAAPHGLLTLQFFTNQVDGGISLGACAGASAPHHVRLGVVLNNERADSHRRPTARCHPDHW